MVITSSTKGVAGCTNCYQLSRSTTIIALFHYTVMFKHAAPGSFTFLCMCLPPLVALGRSSRMHQSPLNWSKSIFTITYQLGQKQTSVHQFVQPCAVQNDSTWTLIIWKWLQLNKPTNKITNQYICLNALYAIDTYTHTHTLTVWAVVWRHILCTLWCLVHNTQLAPLSAPCCLSVQQS